MTVAELKRLHNLTLSAREDAAYFQSLFVAALREAQGSVNMAEVAREVGLHRSRLYQLIDEGK